MVTRERRVDVGQVTLAVTEAGPQDGPVVLLLHGFPDSRWLWRHQVETLAAAGHRVIAPDLRGYGDSDRPDDVASYEVRHLVGDVTGLLDALDVDRAAVVGHDWGAVLAWAYAMARPDRVDRLVAVSVGHPAARGRAGLAQQVKGAYIPVFLVPGLAERLLPAGGWYLLRHAAWGGASPADVPDLARQVEDMSSPGALTAALSWYRANIRLPRPRPRLPGRRRRRVDPRRPARPSSTLACPVMGVWSTGDPALTEAQMTGSARYVTGPWRYERIEGVGHWVPVEAPDELGALLVDFLS
ncbi:alpha/beta fold hydrolase [Aquipuribacter sp. MA13-6]|uniref:alpha/beta fold hydrolase n=1 Tax=unclassified Aquipuribacter TaxID=2635084 RepID=UPI003EE9DA9A